MPEYVRTIPLGAATITVINVGDLQMNLAEALNVPENERNPRYASAFEQPQLFPSQCVHIALPAASILVDANNYTLSFPPGNPYLPPNYSPPPGLMTRLAERGIRPEHITHLIITHAHFDHYSGVTIEQHGQYVPAFPNAHCFLSRADWEHPDTQEALQDPDSSVSRTLGVLQRAGLLVLIDGDCDLLPDVCILAAPGESPGHQLVRVRSQGQTLYCLGDLYHSSLEVEHPTWMAPWADTKANLASRRTLTQEALSEHALLIAAHMPIGRLEQTTEGIKWIDL